MIAAVVFDLDGVLIQSEELWHSVRAELVRERGGRWSGQAQRDMMGMSSGEWSYYMHETLGLRESPDEINREVVRRLSDRYRKELPLVGGATEAVVRLARRWPLGLASSSNRSLIDLVLSLAGIDQLFAATVSSEEVGRGKPSPDVYLEAARQLGVEPRLTAAIEDSSAGITSARAAGLRVIAIPNGAFPPGEQALADADLILPSLEELTADALAGISAS